VAINKAINNYCSSFIARHRCSFEVGILLITVGMRCSDSGKR